MVKTDALRFKQALINLLSNAIKYTAEGEVCMHLRSTANVERGQLDLIVEISDTGSGIQADAIESVFEPFVQATRAGQYNVGTGLGLAISRTFARLLGGDIEVESADGRGSTFSLRIACGALDQTTCVKPEDFELASHEQRDRISRNASLAGLTIHVVEDSSAIANLVTYLLKEAGAKVRYSVNGEEGVQDILESRDRCQLPDLIIMDMLMPVMDGYSATSKLRKNGIDTPIVAMTAFAFSEDRDKCLAAGCNSYLSKPINPASFVEQLSACIR